jgi:hypothetical protein
VHSTPEPIGTTSYPQVPNPTPVRGDVSAGTPPPKKSSELGSEEVTGVHLTPESPAAHLSVRLATDIHLARSSSFHRFTGHLYSQADFITTVPDDIYDTMTFILFYSERVRNLEVLCN